MRLPSIDILRVATVTMIVYRHTFGASELMILSVGVPFFFFLTGWLWRPGSRTVRGEIHHRWRTLGIPYIAWFLILYPIYLARFGLQKGLTWNLAVAPWLGGSYGSAAFTTFWFISALLLVGVMMRLLDHVNRIGLVVLATALLALGGWLGEPLSQIPLSIGLAVPSLAFAILGRILRDVTSAPSARIAGVAALALTGAVLASFHIGRLDIKNGEFGTPFLSALVATAAIWATIVMLDLIFSVLPGQGRAFNRILSPLTRVAIIVVLLHPVILWGLRYFEPSAATPVWFFLVALVVPWAVALLAAQTPAAKYLIGEPPRALQAALSQPTARPNYSVRNPNSSTTRGF